MYLYETVNFFSIGRDSMGLAECRSHYMQARLDQCSSLLNGCIQGHGHKQVDSLNYCQIIANTKTES